MPGRIVSDPAELQHVVRSARRVAVLGIKTEKQSGEAAFYVPEYLQAAGLEVIPVPVYYPHVQEILGIPVQRKVVDVPGEIDILDVFRRPADLAPHLEDIVTKRPRLVWLQTGIRDAAFARALTEVGIDVVQDRCLMVEHRRAR
jgi:predicted CoA-binding protein